MSNGSTLQKLRSLAIGSSFFAPTSLKNAIAQMGFVQADPIRAPARAQDLILRHRVKSYKAGDLEAKYAKLDIEEDLLYAYGFLPRDNWQLLHPRSNYPLSRLEKTILKLAEEHQEIHPRDLEQHVGSERQVNAWGGFSKASTRALEELHYRGLLRISRRQGGIKIYEAGKPFEQPLMPEERLKRLVLLIAKILSPVPESSLRSAINHLGYSVPDLPGRKTIVKELIATGALKVIEVDGTRYLFDGNSNGSGDAPPVVRFLAPFDPLVWDRRRFEQLWGWAYRFEAYTPPAKRRLGYYALPLLFRDQVIGWANVSIKDGNFEVNTGFVEGKPKERAFKTALDEEIQAMKSFLS